MKEIVIFGTGGHAKVVHDIVVKQGAYKPAAFVSLGSTENFLGLPHFRQDELKSLKWRAGVVAVGDNFVRSTLVESIRSLFPDFEFITAVHPSTQIGLGSVLGPGTVIMAHTAINPGSRIGAHVILNTSSSVDHDCEIGDFASLAPGAVLGGNVKIGAFTAVSLGARVIHGRDIGEHSVIGAGATVLKDIPALAVAYGSPCEFVRSRERGEKYLA